MAAHPKRRLFVTGGSGFLGRHVVRFAGAQGWDVAAPPSASLDLRDGPAVIAAVAEQRPAAIIHTAYRRDDRASIVDASRHLAEAAAAVGATLLHVSSDALFAGRPEPYAEADTPDPVHEYGRAKADAEKVVVGLLERVVIVRTSLLIGDGELSPHEQAVRDAIAGTRPMTFFTDEYRSPLPVADLAAALVDLAGRGEVDGMLHIGGPEPMSRADLALAAARHHGWLVDALRFSTIAAAGVARPGRVVLDSSLAESLGLRIRAPFS